MKCFSRAHLTDAALRRVLVEQHGTESEALAESLASLAEYDARRLYLEDGYSSTRAYCEEALGFERDCAHKRIRVARVAREYAAIFPAIADGRLTLSGVLQLKPYLNAANAGELIAAAAHQTRVQIERLLAERFPRLDVPARIETLATSSPSEPLTLQVAPGPPVDPAISARVEPLSPRRSLMQGTVDDDTVRLFREAIELLGLPDSAFDAVLNPALRMFVARLRREKFGATDQPRPARRRVSRNPRYVPDHVKRQVWTRDGGQCAFVSENGHRCGERKHLQFDHILEVAKGGPSTADNVRLLCRAHNQYSAERTFGPGFMEKKREDARRAAAEKRAAAEAKRADEQKRAAADADVIAGLRSVGYRLNEARAAAAFSADLAGGPLETRFKKALSFFRPRARSFDANGVEKVWGSAG